MFSERKDGIGRFCFHRYNYATPGWHEEGIERRIRGSGESTIEKGADTEGHYHIPNGKKVGVGDTIFVSDNSGTGGRWEVGVTYIDASANRIVQDQSDVTGAYFQSTVVGEAK